jgi:hypothetical protein
MRLYKPVKMSSTGLERWGGNGKVGYRTEGRAE